MKQCILKGKSPKITIHFALFDSPQNGNLMNPDGSPNKKLTRLPLQQHMTHFLGQHTESFLQIWEMDLVTSWSDFSMFNNFFSDIPPPTKKPAEIRIESALREKWRVDRVRSTPY